MDEAMQVRAAVLGINPRVYERMEMFDLTKDDAGALQEFSVEGLRQAIGDGLTIQRIIQLVHTHIIWNDGSLHAWTTLARQVGKRKLANLNSRRINKMHEFLGADFSADEALALSENGGILGLRNAVAARKAGIALTDLVEAWAVHYDSSYVEARMAGATHAELLELLQLTKSVASDFRINDYIAVTSKGIATHEQIVAMLNTHDQRDHRRYLEFVLGTNGYSDTVSHQEAIEILASKYSYPDYYWEARRFASHNEVIEIATAGMSAREYVSLREANPRVTHGEIVQLASLGGHTSELTRFIRLIDADCPYADIKQAGMSVSDYYYLRKSEHGPHLTQAQVLEIAGLPISTAQYCDLRQQGIPHDTIVAESAKSP